MLLLLLFDHSSSLRLLHFSYGSVRLFVCFFFALYSPIIDHPTHPTHLPCRDEKKDRKDSCRSQSSDWRFPFGPILEYFRSTHIFPTFRSEGCGILRQLRWFARYERAIFHSQNQYSYELSHFSCIPLRLYFIYFFQLIKTTYIYVEILWGCNRKIQRSIFLLISMNGNVSRYHQKKHGPLYSYFF